MLQPSIQKTTNDMMFQNYPDVLEVPQMCEILNISAKTAYGLLRNGDIHYKKIGRAYKVPKICLIDYLKK